ncbi:DUF3168 domain-containing protein [Cytobacillus horneckiae]|uniref:DUF3168 domain-containing protein n=1 Tax=Cytobacillus horneckiae TaxID=549687 RepID=UPI00399F6CC9
MTTLFNAHHLLLSQLVEDEQLSSLVRGVFDYVPEETEFPCVVLSEVVASPQRTKTNKGVQVEFSIEVWNVKTGKSEILNILDCIEALLETKQIAEDAFFISQEINSIEVLRDEETDYYQGKIKLKILMDMEEI